MKTIIICLLAVAAIIGGIFLMSGPALAPTLDEMHDHEHDVTDHDNIRTDMFTGTLQSVDTGCFVDGECSITVDGKHVTLLLGFNRSEVGSVRGVAGIGDLEQHIGEQVEVYAQDYGNGAYSLYGNDSFYVELIGGDNTTAEPGPATDEEPKPVAVSGCVVGGCSSQLCVDASQGDMASTCEWREVYACYQTATCERQASGQCGWTPTPELNACITNAS